ncbi:hypothetical protein SNOG_01418 [Parastagonospora nodorum SN15]|uniref:Uncharacterized protein n=1 Tax=Phaeosphaeria nodorum (strain SN15 / ATCC MYA-4574 / FGSC 10173) TaxID=321614 RepID=Q0V3J6_PHANO|nr:hypothetical protein SNOG_01418 [Parastagonospora nodorum SN15]EAT91067.1 hypothetical protein SNOG_01418 [Parastagonospora nodorum SN15]
MSSGASTSLSASNDVILCTVCTILTIHTCHVCGGHHARDDGETPFKRRSLIWNTVIPNRHAHSAAVVVRLETIDFDTSHQNTSIYPAKLDSVDDLITQPFSTTLVEISFDIFTFNIGTPRPLMTTFTST